MRCCRSDWPGLCLFCSYVVASRGFFFVLYIFQFTPPPSYGLDLVVNSLEASGNITTAGVVECNSADIGIGPLNFSHNGKEFVGRVGCTISILYLPIKLLERGLGCTDTIHAYLWGSRNHSSVHSIYLLTFVSITLLC